MTLGVHSMPSVAYGPAVEILLTAASRGADFRLQPDHILMRPLAVLTTAERAVLTAAKADEPLIARQLAWRVQAMRRQVPCSPTPIPALLARHSERPLPGMCLSCMEPVPESSGGRCPLCALAAWIALAAYEARVCA